MLIRRFSSPLLLVGVAVWAASLALYLATIAPSLTWGANEIGVDGGELLAAAKTFGVPHPPGYPTYTLLLRGFATAVPIGDFAFRGNLMSAVLAAFSVALVYAVILRFARYLAPNGRAAAYALGASVGAAVFASAPLFWSQAIITEVYTLNTLFAGVLLLIASHLVLRPPSESDSEGPNATRWVALFAFLLGLGLGNHLTLLAVAVPLLLWMGMRLGVRRVVTPWVLGALVLGLGVYLYLPISAAQGPPVNWGGADTLDGLTWMLTGRAYQDYVLGVLKENIERAMQRRPVLDNKGEETGNYVYDGRTVNGAASLLGKHLGMFANRILYQGVTRFNVITGIEGTPGSEVDQSADRRRLTP